MKLKKKANKKWRVIMLTTVFLYTGCMVVYFLWGIEPLYLSLVEKPNNEHQQLVFQIESAKKELANMPNLVDERVTQLEITKELLSSEQNKIPSGLNINNLIRTIIEVANRYQVKAIPLRTTSPESEIIDRYHYSHWRISMSVSGKFQNIVNFVDNLDGKDLLTATIVSVVLERDGKNPETSSIQNDTAPVKGTLELIIYSNSQNYK